MKTIEVTLKPKYQKPATTLTALLVAVSITKLGCYSKDRFTCNIISSQYAKASMFSEKQASSLVSSSGTKDVASQVNKVYQTSSVTYAKTQMITKSDKVDTVIKDLSKINTCTPEERALNVHSIGDRAQALFDEQGCNIVYDILFDPSKKLALKELQQKLLPHVKNTTGFLALLKGSQAVLMIQGERMLVYGICGNKSYFLYDFSSQLLSYSFERDEIEKCIKEYFDARPENADCIPLLIKNDLELTVWPDKKPDDYQPSPASGSMSSLSSLAENQPSNSEEVDSELLSLIDNITTGENRKLALQLLASERQSSGGYGDISMKDIPVATAQSAPLLDASTNVKGASVAQIGLFKAEKTKPKTQKIKILDSFCCPITDDLMKDPVFCILDGRTYERDAIVEALEKFRCSPITRKELPEGQNPEDVLFKDITFSQAMDEFKATFPELYGDSKSHLLMNPNF